MATSFDPRNPKIIAKYGIAELCSEAVEGSGQSYKAGELVQIDASGKVTVAAASSGIYGIVQEDASGTASTATTVQLLGPDDELQMLIVNSAGSAQAHTSAVPGVGYDLNVTSNIHGVDIGTTSNAHFIFVRGIDDSAGDATNYGRFRVLLSDNQVIA